MMPQKNFTLLTIAIFGVLNSSAFARDRSYEIANNPTELFFNNLKGAIIVVGLLGFAIYTLAKNYDERRASANGHLEIPVASSNGIDGPDLQNTTGSTRPTPRFDSSSMPVSGAMTCLTTALFLPLGAGGLIGTAAFLREGEFLPALVSFGFGGIPAYFLISVLWSYFRNR